MLGMCRVDERARGIRVAELERDCDDLDAERMKFTAQRLPPGQVETTASIRCPGDQHHLLSAQR